MPGRLSNRIAIVTGATSGIGRATAILFAAEDAAVVCADINEVPRLSTGPQCDASSSSSHTNTSSESALPTHEVITKSGGKAVFQKCDVGEVAQIRALVERAVKEYGRLDIMFNNAGIANSIERDARPIWELEEDLWDDVLRLNAKSVWLGIQAASRQMVEQEPLKENGDRGWIVNTASVLGLRGSSVPISYVAAKHAVVGLTKAIGLRLSEHRIHVNAVCPGYTDTAMTSAFLANEDIYSALLQRHPFRGLGNPEDVARAVLFLVSEDNTWITGTTLAVDGGFTSM